MAKEFVEREALIAELAKGTIITDDIYGMGIMTGLGRALNVAREAPAADVVEVVHGRWEDLIPKEEKVWVWDVRFKCSECGYTYSKNKNRYSYCPNCGARMDGE